MRIKTVKRTGNEKRGGVANIEGKEQLPAARFSYGADSVSSEGGSKTNEGDVARLFSAESPMYDPGWTRMRAALAREIFLRVLTRITG